LLGTFWGWLMGPHSGLSLRGGTGYPAPHWNLELGTRPLSHRAAAISDRSSLIHSSRIPHFQFQKFVKIREFYTTSKICKNRLAILWLWAHWTGCSGAVL